MVVGVMVWQLHLDASQSLKDKRRVLRSVKDRLRKFNVSIAETAHHDRWQRAELACCVLATDQRHAQQQLQEADRLVDNIPDARIIDSTTRFL